MNVENRSGAVLARKSAESFFLKNPPKNIPPHTHNTTHFDSTPAACGPTKRLAQQQLFGTESVAWAGGKERKG